MSTTKKIVGFVGFTDSSFTNISGYYQHRVVLRAIKRLEDIAGCDAIAFDVHAGVPPERAAVLDYYSMGEELLDGIVVGLAQNPTELETFICQVEKQEGAEGKVIQGHFG